MMTLVITMPPGLDYRLLLPTAVARAQHKVDHFYYYDTDNDGNDYSDYDLESCRLEKDGSEYSISASAIDIFLAETLAELQRLIPFEMHFENRGKFNPRDWKDGDIFYPLSEVLS